MGKGCFIAVAVSVTTTLLALLVFFALEKSTDELGPWKKYRLPATLSPLYYNVTLWPRLEMDAHSLYIFTGHSGVAFRCLNKTRWILIHSYNLNLTLTPEGHHAKLMAMDGPNAPAIKKTWLQEETQYLVLELSEKLQVGKNYWLYTEFQGELTESLRGFYRSEYYEDGIKRVVATTQMEPTDARRAFPCFDEPAMKAVFHVTLIHARGTKALANGMEIGTEIITLDNQKVLQTKFEPTKKMSTYLLAFIVSEFAFVRAPQQEKVLIRIWARRKAIETGQGNYGLNVTGLILDFFQYHYNTSYPLNKSDHVALPDFSHGAMENWGLVTYRETSLLYDPKVSSAHDKEIVVTAISHELAHMWFGNLVTMKWWNDLWLNEGFATYASYLGVSEAEPTWRLKELMVLNVIQPALAVDAHMSSHPLSCSEDEINTPWEINALFNTITYNKGAAVIRMLSEVLSEPVFTEGLHTYLNQFAYGNTVYTDLWEKLQDVVDLYTEISLPTTINEIMNRWTLQMGFPLITIDTQTGRITQKHYLSSPKTKDDKPSIYGYEWFVPIKWMRSGVDMGQYWLLNETDTHLPMKTNSKWVLANLNATGFYRVNYDSRNWQRLLLQLTTNHMVIPVINRAQIMDDAFNLAWTMVMSTTGALSTTRYLSKEMEHLPWETAVKHLDYFTDMLEQTEVFGAMQNYIRQKVQPLFDYFKKITSDWIQISSSYTDQYNQVNAISLGCKYGVKECMKFTSMWYRKWMENPSQNPIQPNLKETVYCHAIAAGGDVEWEFGWKMFKNSTFAPETKRLMYALTCTRKTWLLERYLEYTLDPNMIRKQDVLFIMIHAASSLVGRSVVWSFISANWPHFYTDYDAFFSFENLISLVTWRFSTETELKQLQKFRDEITSSGLESKALLVDKMINRTQSNMNWVAKNKGPIKLWLREESA